jgi:tRNA(Met) cytidine acetyltransferase
MPSYQFNRACWIIEGEVEQSHAILSGKLTPLEKARILRFGPQYTLFNQVAHYLGQECDYLVIDAHDGLPPDAFAAALGTLCGGGFLLILVKDFTAWPEQMDAVRQKLAAYPFTAEQVGRRFMQRLCAHLAQAACVRRLSLDQLAQRTLYPPVNRSLDFTLTDEQQKVIEAVQRVATGHAKRPVVLTADRGRGKSTALGMALAQLLTKHPAKRVIVIAPNAMAVKALFACLPDKSPSQVQFHSPQDYLAAAPVCDLLVVDEAAAIPLPVLQTLLQSHNRLVFSSTVQGYEGSGRGFALRFAKLLDQTMPQWRGLSIHQPVRWAVDDPLERVINEALLLNAALVEAPVASHYTLHWISQDELAADEHMLRALFALLVNAHYQTRPSDLHQLLDAPGLHIQVAMVGDAVLGVVLAVKEGGLPDSLAQAIHAGERRPRGHMLAQSLACHAGLADAPQLRLLRVMRIAVHPACRRLGIGSAMLQAVRQFAMEQGFDLFGTAFGLDVELLPFWRQFGFATVRIGHKRDSASGARSIQMLDGLTQAGKTLQQLAAQRFQQQLPWRLAKSFNDLDAVSVGMLMAGRDCRDLPLSLADQADILAYVGKRRALEDILPTLWRWYCHVLADGGQTALTEQQQSLLLGYLLQHHARKTLLQPLSMNGRAAFEETFRETLKSLLTPTETRPKFRLGTSLRSMRNTIMITVGDQAPSFDLPDADMNRVQSSDFAGKNYVLYFYPKDDTPGCTIESQEFTDLAEDFNAANTLVVGVSKDSCVSHGAFRDKYGLAVQLLADVEGQLCEAYGVWQEKEKNGEKRMGIKRSTFVIDAAGIVRYAQYGVTPKGHAEQIVNFVKTLPR